MRFDRPGLIVGGLGRDIPVKIATACDNGLRRSDMTPPAPPVPMRYSRAALVCGVFAAAGTLVLAQRATPPQDPQQQPPVFRGRTDVVQLDVSVTDKHRKPVRGLQASDFTIREDGQLQNIVTVSEVSVPDEFVTMPVWHKAAPADVASNEVGDKRLFAIIP